MDKHEQYDNAEIAERLARAYVALVYEQTPLGSPDREVRMSASSVAKEIYQGIPDERDDMDIIYAMRGPLRDLCPDYYRYLFFCLISEWWGARAEIPWV